MKSDVDVNRILALLDAEYGTEYRCCGKEFLKE